MCEYPITRKIICARGLAIYFQLVLNHHINNKKGSTMTSILDDILSIKKLADQILSKEPEFNDDGSPNEDYLPPKVSAGYEPRQPRPLGARSETGFDTDADEHNFHFDAQR